PVSHGGWCAQRPRARYRPRFEAAALAVIDQIEHRRQLERRGETAEEREVEQRLERFARDRGALDRGGGQVNEVEALDAAGDRDRELDGVFRVLARSWRVAEPRR